MDTPVVGEAVGKSVRLRGEGGRGLVGVGFRGDGDWGGGDVSRERGGRGGRRVYL